VGRQLWAPDHSGYRCLAGILAAKFRGTDEEFDSLLNGGR
jgi:hypothetical protein